MNQKIVKEFNNWLQTRPKVIRDLGKRYPNYIKYIIKQGAPYAISAPGTIVDIISYCENGDVGVVVFAKNKTRKARKHEKELCEKHGRDFETITSQNIKCTINPIWLEPISN